MHEHHHEKGVLGQARAALLPTCREMSRHTSHELDAPLPLLQRIGVRLHLACCRLCRRYRTQLQWLRRAARQEPPPSLVASRLPEAGRERLRRALREGATAAPTPRTIADPPAPASAPHDDHC
ncbi:MAG TPA: hypothetical protein VMB21_07420 [Candidatus Limnocylindria bacterium]|nr:hypothetical protein [Candidatus Limnocylindria bacterium]